MIGAPLKAPAEAAAWSLKRCEELLRENPTECDRLFFRVQRELADLKRPQPKKQHGKKAG